MPYKDYQQKLEANRRWRGEMMPKGYGKWLYARRKLRFEDADRFRQALELIIADPEDAVEIAREALALSQAAEEELGRFFDR